MRRSGKKGSILVIVVMGAVAFGILVLALSDSFRVSRGEYTYNRIMKRVNTFAEAGMHDALGQLIYNPDACNNLTQTVLVGFDDPHAKYVFSSTCTRCQTQPVEGAFYVAVSATCTIRGKEYAERLHSYISVANVSAYFAAVNNSLEIANGSDLGSGYVYATSLIFDSGPGTTRLGRADYANNGVPPSGGPFGSWGSGNPVEIQDAPNAPRAIVPLLFPQITGSDEARYFQLATVVPANHVTASSFKGHIYPPGFGAFGTMAPDGQDFYATHTDQNRDHVYFFNGDIHIGNPLDTLHVGTTVYGQILFVATGNIYVHGDLYTGTGLGVAADDALLDTLKAGVNLSSSTAHQAVLIPGPGKDVILSGTPAYVTTNPALRRVKALVFAPTGNLVGENASSPPATNLTLAFTGSVILGNQPSLVPFYATRIYAYDNTLKTKPPPYLPALSVIHYEFIENTSSGGVFN